MKPVSGRRMCKAMKRKGWTHTRTESSHYMFNRADSPLTIAVPVHGNQDMPTGTQRRIMRQAGLTDADL